jgi:C-terminal processing protease CtpA/Prc
VASALLAPGYVFYQLSSKSGSSGWGDPFPWNPPPGSEPIYRGRLIVLIDELTGSAADNLAACLRDLKTGVTFIGQRTAGSSGAPRKITLSRTGAQITFCTMRVWSPRDRFIEGNGVVPQRLVRPSRNDIIARRDVALELAVTVAESVSRSGRAAP